MVHANLFNQALQDRLKQIGCAINHGKNLVYKWYKMEATKAILRQLQADSEICKTFVNYLPRYFGQYIFQRLVHFFLMFAGGTFEPNRYKSVNMSKFLSVIRRS
jgi:hypothetical protein